MTVPAVTLVLAVVPVLALGAPVPTHPGRAAVTSGGATVASVVADTVDPAEAVRGPCWAVLACTTELRTRVSFSHPGSQPVTVERIRVANVVAVRDTGRVQAQFGSPVILIDGREGTTLDLPAGDGATVEVRVPGIRRAGAYEISVRGSTPDGPVSAAATVHVRDTVWNAIALVLAGSVLAWVLRRWIGGARDRLSRRVDVDEVLRDHEDVLRARAPAPARAAVAAEVKALIDRVAADARWGTDAAQLPARISELRDRVRLLDRWLGVAAKADEARDADAQDLVTSAAALLVRTEAATAEEKERYEERLAVATGLAAPAPEALRDTIRDLVAAPAPPLGVDGASWMDLKADVERRAGTGDSPPALTTGQARRLLQDTLRTLVVGIQAGSEAAAGQAAEPERSQLQAVVAAARETLALLEKVTSDAPQSLDAAVEAYKALLTRVRDLPQRPGRMGGQGSAESQGVDVDQLPALVSVKPDPTTLAERSRVLRRVMLLLGDSAAALAVTAITVLLGLVVLYLPDDAWGSDSDLLTAFLWGLGLTQVGGAASTGIEGTWATFRAKEQTDG